MSAAKRFAPATKSSARLRLGLVGSAGSGKTYSALAIAEGIGGRVALIDSERGSASKYAGLFSFDTLDLERHSPIDYVEAIHAAEAEGYDVVIIDSLSHAWIGKGGALEMVDQAAKRSRSGNNFTAWRGVTPEHNRLVDAMLTSRCHLIATIRAKTEWVIEEDEKGRKVPRKLGLAPVQREGLDYEFDVVGDLAGAELVISKTRCHALAGADGKGRVIPRPGRALGQELRAWLSDGAPAPVAAPAMPAEHRADVAAENVQAARQADWQKRVAACVDPFTAQCLTDEAKAWRLPPGEQRDAVRAVLAEMMDRVRSQPRAEREPGVEG